MSLKIFDFILKLTAMDKNRDAAMCEGCWSDSSLCFAIWFCKSNIF